MKEKLSCPNCNSVQIQPFISRKNVPVYQNLVFDQLNNALQVSRGDLDLFLCEDCGFVYNKAFESSKLIYTPQYNAVQNFSSTFNQYMDELIQSIMKENDLSRVKVIEIGCGKAVFLKKLFSINEELVGYGFDPSYEGLDKEFNGRLTFVKDFYGSQYEHIQADIIICRHVIASIPNVVELLTTLRKALIDSPDARVYFETPCLEWVLRNNAVWDIYYEYCSYFSSSSLTIAFQLAGFKVERIHHVFNGQYMWVEAVLHGNPGEGYSGVYRIISLINTYREQEGAIINRWKRVLADLLTAGPVAVWGAGAKGATFVNLVDPYNDYIQFVVDMNPRKQNCFLPGSGHPIVHFQSLKEHNVSSVIIMNPNYKEEIKKMILENELSINLIELE